MSYRYLSLASVILLGACAYATKGSVQELTLVTPGAHNALCYVYVNNFKFKYRPPQTITVPQSRQDLVVDCMAPGNRNRKIYIEPTIAGSFYGNVANGVVIGAAWDSLSGAMYEYPSVIEVNFEYTPIEPEPLPAQNNPDIKQPEDYHLEEFKPGDPRLNSDRYDPPVEIRRRERGGGSFVEAETFDNLATTQTAAAVDTGKGDLMEVISKLGPDINPATPTTAPAIETAPLPQAIQGSEEGGGAESGVYGPIPLYPGE